MSHKEKEPNAVSFYAMVSDSVRQHISIDPVAEFVRKEGLKGGGKGSAIQGGGALADRAGFKERLIALFESLSARIA